MSLANQVKVINFKAIPDEDDHFRNVQVQDNIKAKTISNSKKNQLVFNQNEKKNTRERTGNFTFEYAYPAVIFDRVCFSVYKSSQQSSFLDKLVCKCRKKSSINKQEEEEEEDKIQILKSINLNVPYGSIFGLLGPSSCGKTTLLRCLVGLLKQSSGSIRLFGHNCETKDQHSSVMCDALNCCNFEDDHEDLRHCNWQEARSKCKVPGANVGYMPQELGLYEDFSISQLLTMFGRYMSMEDELIKTRIKFMAEFLDLPDVNRTICSLSGGQKRRVSFAVACLHMPPLIILDEPTVGVDPLLRQSIWKYLRRLADEENKTIIITTHYIEEAAQADQVALMRAGEILIQDTPKRIMQLNDSRSLEEAFLKICNNVSIKNQVEQQRTKLCPQPAFKWTQPLESKLGDIKTMEISKDKMSEENIEDNLVLELKQRAQEKLDLFDLLHSEKNAQQKQAEIDSTDNLNGISVTNGKESKVTHRQRDKFIIEEGFYDKKKRKFFHLNNEASYSFETGLTKDIKMKKKKLDISDKLKKFFKLTYALLYKNYRRNVNMLPLIAFQFLLPIVQMVSFSLCVGGRPTEIGLGLVNLDQLPVISDQLLNITNSNSFLNKTGVSLTEDDSGGVYSEELLSESYISFIDTSIISIKPYKNLASALDDVRKAKLWAAMEIGENFTTTILRRFDLENFYQLDKDTIRQSVIRIYPDRSNKILDMICQRSLVNAYRQFLLNQFEHFKTLPIEIKRPVFEIEPNLISNSIDGYTESIAAGLLASLTYIMAAGLTTFIMVVERGNGVLERTYTSGINPVAYLLAHALFRTFVMMLQVALVMFLTFYILKQPMVGNPLLAFLVLMTLNLTGISYGLLISSLVTDQNGAALTIVSSLVVKITMSGILWPLEAIPQWMRLFCYAQPLTMPVQALKAITLKGASLNDKSVYLGLSVSLAWLVLFLTIAARRFRFYQH